MMLQHLDAQDCLGLQQTGGVYERADTSYVKSVLKPGQTFVDVGAHIGYYTTLAAGLVGLTGHVFAFEPEPANFANLALNTEPYGNGVRLYACAVSERSGLETLHLSAANSGDHRLYASDPAKPRDTVRVQVIALDDVPELASRAIDFLKIDSQGLETRVLRGARGIIGRSPNLKGIVEYAPWLLEYAGSSAKELLLTLQEMGLRVDKSPAELARVKKFINLHIEKSQ
jgi:FkbM family methyltransferase